MSIEINETQPIAAESAIAPVSETSPIASALTSEGMLADRPPSAAWILHKARIDAFWADPGTHLANIWKVYQPIVVSVLYLTIAIVVLQFLANLIHFFTHLPILGTFFELIGIGYFVWFVNRYLLTAEKRQELSQKIERFQQDVLGTTQNVAHDVKAVATTIQQGFTETANSVKPDIKKIATDVQHSTRDVADVAQAGAQSVADDINHLTETVQSTTSDVTETVSSTAKETAAAAQSTAHSIAADVQDRATEAKAVADDVSHDVSDAIDEAADRTESAIDSTEARA